MFRLTNGLDDLDGFKKKINQLLEIGGFIFCATFSMPLKESEKPEKQHWLSWLHDLLWSD